MTKACPCRRLFSGVVLYEWFLTLPPDVILTVRRRLTNNHLIHYEQNHLAGLLGHKVLHFLVFSCASYCNLCLVDYFLLISFRLTACGLDVLVGFWSFCR